MTMKHMTKSEKFASILFPVLAISMVVKDGAVIFNFVLAICVIGFVARQLFSYAHEYNDIERIAMGLIGGGMLMSTPALWLENTPFDPWAFNIARAGLALYLFSDFRRRAHDRIARRELRTLRTAHGRPGSDRGNGSSNP